MSFSQEDIAQELQRRGVLNSNNFSSDDIQNELIHRGVLKDPNNTIGQQALRYGVKDPLAGLAELGHGAINAPHNLAALFSEKLASHIPTQANFDYSAALGIPENKKNLVDRLIQSAPELATSMALPETKLGSLGTAIENIPKVGSYLKTGLGNALSQGLFAASQSPHDQTTDGLTAGGIAAPLSVLAKGTLEADPMVKNISRALLGLGSGALGYQGAKAVGAGDYGSDIFGALLGMAGYKGGSAKKLAAENVLKGVEGTNYEEPLAASRRLGLSYLTPAEASQNPFTGATQGTVGKTEGGAQLLYKQGQQRFGTEQNAIGNLYNTITKSPEIASRAIRDSAQQEIAKLQQQRLDASEPYYTAAHEKKVAPSWVKNLENSNATIKNAIQEAMSDPKYQVEGELLGVPKNSIKVLDYAKRKIDAQIAQAQNFGDNDAVRVLTNSKNTLVDKISKVDRDYATARKVYEQHSRPIEQLQNSQIGTIANTKDTKLKNISSSIFDPAQTDISVLRKIKEVVNNNNPEAWNGIIKNEMQRLMGKAKKGGGTDFYNKVLSNDNQFNQFKVALEDNPNASQQLDDMKQIFGKLINTNNAKGAEALSRTSMSKERSTSQKAMSMLKEILSGGKYDKAAVELTTNPAWEKELAKLKNISNSDKFVGNAYKLFGTAGAQTGAQMATQ